MAPIEISYCTTCRGRLHQLRETLPGNLAALRDDEEIVLVDYRSPDGLAEWVWSTFSPAIEGGRLRFFEVLGEAPWHMAKAKNLAHRLGRGAYLFNLDGDNLLTRNDAALIRAAKDRGLGCRQGTGNIRDGTPGRIGISGATFFDLGGYDEGLLGMTLQDYDLIVRAEAVGYRFARLGPPQHMPVQNSRTERLEQYIVGQDPIPHDNDRLGRVNLAVHKLRLELEGPRRRHNFATFRGRLNGKEVILDGLGNIRLLTEEKS